MLSSETVQCPFCGQTFELEIEYVACPQSFVTDCEICCRPMEVRVSCEAGGIAEVTVMGAG
jgi:hypothetical protein